MASRQAQPWPTMAVSQRCLLPTEVAKRPPGVRLAVPWRLPSLGSRAPPRCLRLPLAPQPTALWQRLSMVAPGSAVADFPAFPLQSSAQWRALLARHLRLPAAYPDHQT